MIVIDISHKRHTKSTTSNEYNLLRGNTNIFNIIHPPSAIYQQLVYI